MRSWKRASWEEIRAGGSMQSPESYSNNLKSSSEVILLCLWLQRKLTTLSYHSDYRLQHSLCKSILENPLNVIFNLFQICEESFLGFFRVFFKFGLVSCFVLVWCGFWVFLGGRHWVYLVLVWFFSLGRGSTYLIWTEFEHTVYQMVWELY